MAISSGVAGGVGGFLARAAHVHRDHLATLVTAAAVVAVPAAAITGLVRRWLLRQVESSLPPTSLDPSVGSELGSKMGLTLAGLLVIVVATIDSLPSTTTSTVPAAPVPTSTP